MRLQRSQVTWSQLRVGIFSLICGAVLLWLVLFAANGLKAVQNRFTVQTVIDSASGLKSGDVVRLAGIEVWKQSRQLNLFARMVRKKSEYN